MSNKPQATQCLSRQRKTTQTLHAHNKSHSTCHELHTLHAATQDEATTADKKAAELGASHKCALDGCAAHVLTNDSARPCMAGDMRFWPSMPLQRMCAVGERHPQSSAAGLARPDVPIV